MVANPHCQPQTNGSHYEDPRFRTTVSRHPSHPGGPSVKACKTLRLVIFSSWETVGIAAVVAVGASLLVVGLASILLRRLRDGPGIPEERVSALVRELDLRMRRLGESLSEEL